MDEHLLIVGASARAAAFSALRAGLRPWCTDLFGDADLRLRCPAQVLPARDYPDGLLPILDQAPSGPWLYTGSLENRPQLVHRLAGLRTLWGNDANVLALARSPSAIKRILLARGLPCPNTCSESAQVPPGEHWLVKPLHGAGGAGIAFWTAGRSTRWRRKHYYFQQYIEGESAAAIYVGDGHRAALLGVTRQLVGESWLGATSFRYCGSVGPLCLTPRSQEAFAHLGEALVQGCGLRGLFGVDCILRAGVPFPVEINPRYTASVEVLEYAFGFSALALHRRVFDPGAAVSIISPGQASHFVGKGILFAKAPLTFPRSGPWSANLEAPTCVEELPVFADIPHAGQRIEGGRPILTLFARATNMPACLDSLRQTAEALDRLLFNG